MLTAVVTSRYPATNNQLRTSSNPHQQATINNGRVTIQPIQERQNSMSLVRQDRLHQDQVLQEEELEFLADAENEHLKQTYKQLYDSVKSSCVRSKEQCDDLINKVNLKSAEVSDLNASLQEKVLVIIALKEQLNKLKGKAIITEAVSLNPIDPELLKVDVAPLSLSGYRKGHPKISPHMANSLVVIALYSAWPSVAHFMLVVEG
nr:hypothetical protein [Tanacetum cinerariifolium]